MAGIIRFGAFELDLKSGELRKSGLKIHLREQPFRILAMLLDRQGDAARTVGHVRVPIAYCQAEMAPWFPRKDLWM